MITKQELQSYIDKFKNEEIKRHQTAINIIVNSIGDFEEKIIFAAKRGEVYAHFHYNCNLFKGLYICGRDIQSIKNGVVKYYSDKYPDLKLYSDKNSEDTFYVQWVD